MLEILGRRWRRRLGIAFRVLRRARARWGEGEADVLRTLLRNGMGVGGLRRLRSAIVVCKRLASWRDKRRCGVCLRPRQQAITVCHPGAAYRSLPLICQDELVRNRPLRGVRDVLPKMLPNLRVKAHVWQIARAYCKRAARQCNCTPKAMYAETHLSIDLGLVLAPPPRTLSSERRWH